MFQHKSFNPKVIIVDHFDDVKNQIDIRTETIFHEKRNFLSENRKQFLNKLRQSFWTKLIKSKRRTFRYSRHTTTKKHLKQNGAM